MTDTMNDLSGGEIYATASDLSYQFKKLMADASCAGILEEILSDFWGGMSDEDRAEIALQLLGGSIGRDKSRTVRNHAAVDFAQVFGPDWSQDLYHFAVQMTKLA